MDDFCDCKFGTFEFPSEVHVQDKLGEAAGCPEIRLCIKLLEAMSDEEYQRASAPRVKRCPFCGEIACCQPCGERFRGWYSVICLSEVCRAEGPLHRTESEAVAAWNRRVGGESDET